jgi:hypothetical protein
MSNNTNLDNDINNDDNNYYQKNNGLDIGDIICISIIFGISLIYIGRVYYYYIKSKKRDECNEEVEIRIRSSNQNLQVPQ